MEDHKTKVAAQFKDELPEAIFQLILAIHDATTSKAIRGLNLEQWFALRLDLRKAKRLFPGIEE